MMKNYEIKNTAKDNLKGSWGTSFLAEVLVDAASIVGTFIPFGGFILSGPLEVGKTQIYVNAADHQKPSVKDMLAGFRENFGENFMLVLLKSLFLFGWSLLFLIPGLVKGYSYAMSTYLITRNKNMTATEAITESRRLMDGHKFDLFKLNLSFLGWTLLTLVTFGIAGIYTIPYMHAAHTVFFDQIYQA